MFKNPHFSRADIACDILNLPDDYVSQYRLADAVSFRPYYGTNGRALRLPIGAHVRLNVKIRMYNKRLEQEKKRQVCPKR